jgi:NAD(P)H-dependent flavin oxidoreductase YrpB (nitropropane dioxygenase family)
MTHDPRTLRQRLVAEIGEQGQERVSRARAQVHDSSLSGEVEARYLVGAAFGCVRTPSYAVLRAAREGAADAVLEADAPRMALPSPEVLAPLEADGADDAVLAIARGAARALRQIRAAALDPSR